MGTTALKIYGDLAAVGRLVSSESVFAARGVKPAPPLLERLKIIELFRAESLNG